VSRTTRRLRAATGLAGLIALESLTCTSSSPRTDSDAARVVALTSAANGRTVKVPRGARVTLTLPGSPGTGYTWIVVDSGGPVLREFAVDAAGIRSPDEGELDASAEFAWHAEAATSGTGTLRLEYRRPWDRGAKAERVVSITVRVQ
jgi:inhibitor of cysteine peptidase